MINAALKINDNIQVKFVWEKKLSWSYLTVT